MNIWLEAFGYLSQLVLILTKIKAAEDAGQGTVDLPPIFIHHHKANWTLTGKAERSTTPNSPPQPLVSNPTLPGMPAPPA